MQLLKQIVCKTRLKDELSKTSQDPTLFWKTIKRIITEEPPTDPNIAPDGYRPTHVLNPDTISDKGAQHLKYNFETLFLKVMYSKFGVIGPELLE